MKVSAHVFFAWSILATQTIDAFSPHPTRRITSLKTILFETKDDVESQTETGSGYSKYTGKRGKLRKKVSKLAKRIVPKPIVDSVAPQAIAEIITDATSGALDIALEEASRLSGQVRDDGAFKYTEILEKEAIIESDTEIALDNIALAKTTAADTFALAETAIEETEEALRKSKLALAKCKENVAKAIAIAEKSAQHANLVSQRATALAASAAISASESAGAGVQEVKDKEAEEMQIGHKVSESVQESVSVDEFDVSSLEYDDVDYHLSEMSPPFIGEAECLVPGEAVVRVEKAMDNSRRIFAGVDILASVDDVWKVLTDYDNLQKVVPNLAVNEVVERYEGDTNGEINYESDSSLSSEEQIKVLSKQMRGSQLKQIGKAKVVGINFSAQVTLEVREWPNGIPDFFHFNDDVYEGYSRTERAKLESKRRLERYHFPRPFAISKLPTKDISMQSIENDDGEFRLYQGVWRMQPLPGCAPEGGAAMRLTYAVEISPRPYLPVALVENRISKDLCNNLLAIREFVTK